VRLAALPVEAIEESAGIMNGVLTLKLNDAAVQALGVTNGMQGTAPPGGLSVGLQRRIDRGLTRRGAVLTWADSVGAAAGAPSFFNDLTAWECADSSFHIEDHVPAVHVAIVDEAPVISDSDQRILLVHGLAFGLQFSRLVYALDPPSPVRCIIAANDTNATFRFHQIRHGEFWNTPDLDSYRQDKAIVMDIEPDTGG
jgi:hypothetical protein